MLRSSTQANFLRLHHVSSFAPRIQDLRDVAMPRSARFAIVVAIARIRAGRGAKSRESGRYGVDAHVVGAGFVHDDSRLEPFLCRTCPIQKRVVGDDAMFRDLFAR